jgi:hypothetical protein
MNKMCFFTVYFIVFCDVYSKLRLVIAFIALATLAQTQNQQDSCGAKRHNYLW